MLTKLVLSMLLLPPSWVESFHQNTVIKPYPPVPKYIQGLEFGNGHLFYGTNDGKVVCIGRHEQQSSHLIHRWSVPVASRNIRRIQTTQKYLLASCDPEDVQATGKSVLCDLKSGQPLEAVTWTDTTVYEGMSLSQEWMRVNARGDIYSKQCPRDADFQWRLRIPLSSHDQIVCGTLFNDHLYLMTLSGNLWVVEHGSKIVGRHRTKFPLATTIHVTRPLRSDNSVFVYVGNQQGEVYFTQITDDACISYTQKRLHDCVVTQMDCNTRGLFVAFEDSTIVGMEILSFRETMRIKGNSHFYTNVDAFSLSPRGLFYISDNDTRIRMTSLAHG